MSRLNKDDYFIQIPPLSGIYNGQMIKITVQGPFLMVDENRKQGKTVNSYKSSAILAPTRDWLAVFNLIFNGRFFVLI